uniref:CD4 n=1 Tax=Plecoglossus altivelis TaxID=61084 RepID=A0A856EBK9_PLEAT|nr:CD4 [Plecoglossus altivelis]
MKIALLLCALCLVPLEGTILFVKRGMSAKINCGVHIRNQNVEWTFGDKRSLIVRLNGKTGASNKGKFPNIHVKRSGEHLEIPNVGVGDLGSYICKVDHTEYSHRLYIIEASVSPSGDVPLGSAASLHCQTSGDPKPQVEWLRPGGGSAPSSGQVQLSSVTLEDAGIWTCRISKDKETLHQETVSLRVQSLRPTVPPSTPRDLSVSRCPHCGTNLQPGQTEGGKVGGSPKDGSPLWGLSLWVWLAAGAGGLVLILLVVLVILVRRRNRRMKRRVHKMRTTRQPLKPNEYCHCNSAVLRPPQGRPRDKTKPVAKQQR